MVIILGFETSCDESAVAIIKNKKLLSINTNKNTSKIWWCCSRDSFFLHMENIVSFFKKALNKAKLK
jgi:tRNA A37 threonylcarbamoyltransferase TsaD